jgi:GT2 family glycosyltransferase
MVRRDPFLGIGGFRANFEYYGEEKELCLRLLDRGYTTLYLPAAPIAHVTDPRSRNLRKYLRLVSRNDCLNSLYNDPLTRVVWMVPARLYLYFRMRRGWKVHDPGGAWWVVSDLVRHLPETLKLRHPVARATLARWQRLKTAPEPWPAMEPRS